MTGQQAVPGQPPLPHVTTGQHGAMGPPEGGGAPYPMTGPAVPARRRRAKVWLAVVTALVLLAAAGIALLLNGWRPLAFGEQSGPEQETSEQGPAGTFATVVDKVAGTGKIVIGVKGDLPGVGLQNGDDFQGFDIEIAKRVATELGAKETTFVRVGRDDRASSLADDRVDLVIATYSVDKSETRFAGPYYLAHQDILVRAGVGVESIEDLKGKKICAPDSPSVGAVQDRVKVEPVSATNYAVCMDMLRSGAVDAVPGDDLILAGFAARENMRFKILGVKLTNERYSVGIKKGDVKTCKAVKAVIADLYTTGFIKQLIVKQFGTVDFQAELKVPAMESC